MAQVTELRTPEDVEAMLQASHEGPVVVLKHSIACAASARGEAQFALLEAPDDPPRYAVVVQYARAASRYVAERLGVRHETPQVLVIRNGEVVLHLSHGAIRTERLREAALHAV
jgi:thioredoxin 1